MSEVRAQIRNRGAVSGGITGYPLDKLYEEVAFLAYHFHWDHDTILNMEHGERQQWCEEVSKINKKVNAEGSRSILDV